MKCRNQCVYVCVSVFVPCKLPVLPFEMYDRANPSEDWPDEPSSGESGARPSMICIPFCTRSALIARNNPERVLVPQRLGVFRSLKSTECFHYRI